MSATWSYNIRDQFKIVQLNLEGPSKWDPTVKSQYHMFYQSWAWGACSCATLWGWSGIPREYCTDEALAGFIKNLVLGVRPNISSWDPHRAFAQVPAVGRDEETGEHGYPTPFFEFLMERVYPDTKPVYEFRNRSHESTMQRLFDLDTDQMLNWLSRYNHEQAEQQKAKQAEAAARSSSNGTIIPARAGVVPLGKHLEGSRPLAPGEYFR